MLQLRREQVVAYRVGAHGLLRNTASVTKLAVLDIGVQDSAESAALALDARLPETPPQDFAGPDRPLALAWTLRGAPHLHRRGDLDRIAAALWPLSDADALFRLDASSSMKKAGLRGLSGFATSVEALRKIVTAPMGKGAVSTALTAATPDAMHRYCRGCKATHVFEMPLRMGTLPAGIELEPDTAPPVLVPRAHAALPDGPDISALQWLARGYLALLGPGTEADVADYLGMRRAELVENWPDGLEQVSVEGREAWLPAERVATVRRARPPRVTRLLAAFDPYLQARDRALLVPDSSLHKVLWPILGRPGVLLVDGEVLGIWRPKRSKARLEITVTAFAPLPPAVRRDVATEAERIAAVRGSTDVQLVYAE